MRSLGEEGVAGGARCLPEAALVRSLPTPGGCCIADMCCMMQTPLSAASPERTVDTMRHHHLEQAAVLSLPADTGTCGGVYMWRAGRER